jgi:hypothetical protein
MTGTLAVGPANAGAAPADPALPEFSAFPDPPRAEAEIRTAPLRNRVEQLEREKEELVFQLEKTINYANEIASRLNRLVFDQLGL